MNKKTLIILLIVAIVLIVTAVWVTTLTPQNDTVTDEEAKSYPTAAISLTPYSLHSCKYNSISSSFSLK